MNVWVCFNTVHSLRIVGIGSWNQSTFMTLNGKYMLTLIRRSRLSYFEELRLFGQVECKNDATRMKIDWTGRCTFGENFVG